MIERYVLRGDGLEQTFGFESLAERAEIVVTVGAVRSMCTVAVTVDDSPTLSTVVPVTI